MRLNLLLLFVVFILVFTGCNNNEKVDPKESTKTNNTSKTKVENGDDGKSTQQDLDQVLEKIHKGLKNVIEEKKVQSFAIIPSKGSKTSVPSSWVGVEIMKRKKELIDELYTKVETTLRKYVINVAGCGEVERENLDKIMKEQAKLLDDLYNQGVEGQELGKLAIADAILFITIKPTFEDKGAHNKKIHHTGWWHDIEGRYEIEISLSSTTTGKKIWYNVKSWSKVFDVKKN